MSNEASQSVDLTEDVKVKKVQKDRVYNPYEDELTADEMRKKLRDMGVPKAMKFKHVTCIVLLKDYEKIAAKEADAKKKNAEKKEAKAKEEGEESPKEKKKEKKEKKAEKPEKSEKKKDSPAPKKRKTE
jgi:hypothetical protein